ncbi:MAG TPA: MASE1 domain-containing protein, partial [Terriglobales bacterium]|nr:MASE1 domain-containing protein [Terriglobales bacterium]
MTLVRRSFPAMFRDIAVVSALYFIAGKAGLAVPYTSGNVSPVWPAAGVAVAALVIRGYCVWPGIAIGAFLVNFFSPIPHLAAFGIGAGNVLGPLLIAWLLGRCTKGRLTHLADLGWLIACTLPGTLLSAVTGNIALMLTGVRAWQSAPAAGLVWWMGDSLGVLLITPLLLRAADLRLSKTRAAELAALLVALVLFAALLFSGQHVTEEVLGFAVLPFIIWGAVRFGIAGAALASCTVSSVAIWATSHSSGPFVHYRAALYDAGLLQAFIATISISGLSLAAVISERYATQQALAREEELRRAEEALRRSDRLAALGRLAATISHEVNNPLAACVNLVHLIGRKALDNETREFIALLEQELLRVAAITKRTLGFVRESSERVQSSIPTLLDETLTLYE